MVNLHEEVRANKRNSNIVLIMFFLFSALIFGIATFIFSYGLNKENPLAGFFIAYPIVMSLVVLYIFYFLGNGDKMILGVTGAVEADRKTYPYLYHTTEALSLAAGMRTPPKCYVIKDTALNAYATGFKPENSYIVVTTGLMDKLNRQELEGVLAHEMSHIKNQDIKLMLYVAGLMGLFTLIGTYFYYMMIMPSNSKESGKGKILAFGMWILFH